MARDIGEWLESLGLGRYVESFADNEIDLHALPHITEDDLKEIGVALGARRKILAAIAELGGSREPAVVDEKFDEQSSSAEAERRQLTVMFCDLVGSTALSTRLDPEDYRDLIRAYQDACAGVVARFDGFIAKFMGDGVLVYFGWPRAHEDDPERAINAGLGITEAVRAITDGANSQLSVRTGIATGRVVVGDIVGESAAQEATITGEAPNLAARLQAIAEPNTIVIAAATHALAGELFECTRLDAQNLKGFDAPVVAWRVDGTRAIESRFEATHTQALTPLLGRDEEIEILERRWQRACAGEGQVVLISGEPGIGKSRIVSELQDRIGPQTHTGLRYQCSPYYTNSALHPVIGQLERAARIQPDNAPDEKLEKLEALLQLSGRPLADAIPLIAPLLSIPLGDRYTPVNVSPQRQKQLTLTTLVDQFAGLAEQRPVLFHFEDAHWIDPTSRELIDLIVTRAHDLPALVAISFRPEFTQTWTGEPHVTLLTLNKLNPRNCVDMATEMGASAVLSAEVIDKIVARCDGVPLFVEEMTKTVLEAGADGSAAPDNATPIAIPASIEDSLMARLDRLGPVKEVAQIAAVLGRTFSQEVLAATAELDEAALGTALERLVAAELIYPRAVAGAVAYEFKHALVQDAAYQSLLKRRRQGHHERIAKVLEAQFREFAEPELLAHHYTEAGCFEEAVDHWLDAGRHAIQRSAYIEAEDHLRKGLGLLDNLSETPARFRREIDLQNTLGVCLMPTRGFGNPEVAESFTRAADICERIEDNRRLFVALRGKGQYHMISGDMRTACHDTRSILSLAERVDDHGFLIEAHHLGWSALCFSGDYIAAQKHAEEGIARYDRDRDHQLTYVYSGHDPGMCCRAFGSLSLGQLGYPDQALELCRDGLELAEALEHPFTVAIALWATGILHQLRREPEATGEAGERMVSYCSEKGLPPLVPLGEVFVGDALARQGNYNDGIKLMRAGVDKLQSTHTMFSLPSFFPALAEAYLRDGSCNDAMGAIEEGFALALAGGDHFSLPEMHRVKAKLLLSQSADNKVAAEAAYNEAIETARHQQARFLGLRATTELARLWGENGKREAACEMLKAVYGAFTEGFNTPDLKDAKALLDELS
jgi:class 3 adenylate cyclase/predicted ATPase